MGLDSLSMSSFNLPKIKYLIRHLSQGAACECLGELLRCGDEQAVRSRAAEELEARGLAHMVAAGPIPEARAAGSSLVV